MHAGNPELSHTLTSNIGRLITLTKCNNIILSEWAHSPKYPCAQVLNDMPPNSDTRHLATRRVTSNILFNAGGSEPVVGHPPNTDDQEGSELMIINSQEYSCFRNSLCTPGVGSIITALHRRHHTARKKHLYTIIQPRSQAPLCMLKKNPR